MYFIKFHKRTGDSLAEYALILGVVTLAFIGMNTYIKRGFQGRMKDMSDKFISNQQVQEMDPTTVSNSLSRTWTPENKVNTVTRELLSGGAIKTGISEETRIEIQRHSVTQADPSTAPQDTVQSKGIDKPAYGDGGAAVAAQAAEDEYLRQHAGGRW